MLTDVLSAYGHVAGVVTLSLFDWNLPTAANFNGWDFKDLSCRSIVHIGPISLNVTMPSHDLVLRRVVRINHGASILADEQNVIGLFVFPKVHTRRAQRHSGNA